jgi:hypothetical protein
MKTWIAINLRDFHRPEKAWQQGEDNRVMVKIVGAKTLDRAKETAQHGNNDPWMVFGMSDTKHIIYAKPDAEALTKDLRAMWDKRGVPKERQDEILADIEAKAKPGAMVGPFQIPK